MSYIAGTVPIVVNVLVHVNVPLNENTTIRAHRLPRSREHVPFRGTFTSTCTFTG